MWKKIWKNLFEGGARPSRRTKIAAAAITLFIAAPVFFYVPFMANGSACASAPASNLISDLRAMKAAALMSKTDRTEPPMEGVNHVALLAPYLGNPMKFLKTDAPFAFVVSDGVRWVGRRIDRPSERRRKRETDVPEKLEGKAAQLGLRGSPSTSVPPVSDDAALVYRATDGAVWIRAY
jgi:hypothetical protein